MIRVELLPASFGDCILVEYGKRTVEHRILIDAGLAETYKDYLKPRLAKIAQTVPLELLVVTHIDRDHIRGILPLLKEKKPTIAAKDIWFNGYAQISDRLGAADGEALGKLLKASGLPWNEAFERRAVMVPSRGALPKKKLAGGATVTLVSPYREQLIALAADWKNDKLGTWDRTPPPAKKVGNDEIDDILGKRPPLRSLSTSSIANLAAIPFKEDTKSPNGSSIAFLFEYDGKRVLFAADAHPTPMLQSLNRLSPNTKLSLDAFKLSHHGSMNNLSPALLDKVACTTFLVSSNGSSFGHPHPETLARIVARKGRRRGKTSLQFNYKSDYTKVWNTAATRTHYAYETIYPSSAGEGIVLEL